MNRTVSHTYITLEDTDRSLPALAKAPEMTHDISIGRLTVLKYPTLYMFRVHVEAYTTVPSELNIFHRCSQKLCVFYAHLDFILVHAQSRRFPTEIASETVLQCACGKTGYIGLC